jgi:hypothetical protein
MYADYTPFEMNRNFFDLLKTFIFTSVDTVRLEQDILTLRGQVEQKKNEYALTLERLDAFKDDVLLTISSSQKDDEDLPILQESKEKANKIIEELIEENGKHTSTLYNQEVFELERKIGEAQSKTLVTLERFFLLNPLPIITSSMMINVRIKDSYESEIELHSDGGIGYSVMSQCDKTSFWQRERKISDLQIDGALVPVRLKKQLLGKDYQIETIKLNDFYIAKYQQLEEGNVELILLKELRKDTEKVEISYSPPDQGGVSGLFYTQEGKRVDILASKELGQNLNQQDLLDLKTALEQKITEVKSATRVLKTVLLKSEDVIQTNNLSSLAKHIAELYGVTVQEIRNRGSRPKELILRLENEGTRNEYFYPIKDAIHSLADIGEVGNEIAKILGFLK